MKLGSDYDVSAKLAAKMEDETSKYMWGVFRSGTGWRDSQPCGATTLGAEFVESYRQYHGTDAHKYLTANGDYIYENFAATKVSVVLAFMNKVGFDESGIPFQLEPTPIPEMSGADKEVTTNRAILNLISLGGQLTMGLQNPETLLQRLQSEDPTIRHLASLETAGAKEILEEYVDTVRYEYEEDLRGKARDKAANMEELIRDQLKEGQFVDSLAQFREDVLVYPYAAVEGPLPEAIVRPKWDKNKVVNEVVIKPKFRTVRPWDVVWSPDSTSTNDGTYVMVRKYYSREDLLNMMEATDSPYITEAVRDILEAMAWLEDPETAHRFAEYVAEHPIVIDYGSLYKVPHGGAITGLTYYGKLSGVALKKFGFSIDVDKEALVDYKLYECELTMIAGRLVKATVYKNPNTIPRPINIVAIKGKTYGMYGDSYIGSFRYLEQAYNSKLVWEHTNDYATSADLLEIDTTRLSVEDIKAIADRQKAGNPIVVKPGTVISASNESMMGGTPQRAVTPHRLAEVHPNRRISLASISAAIDRLSGVPASMHGEASSSGMLRSFKTVFLLEGNATSILTNMAAEIDKDLYYPIATSMNLYNLMHSDDDRVKGDVIVLAGGVKGAVEKEVEAERKKEDGMVIVQAMGMAQHISSPELRAKTEAYVTLGLEELLTTTGVDPARADRLTKVLLQNMYQREEQAAIAEQQQQQQAAMAQEGQQQQAQPQPEEELNVNVTEVN